MKEISLLLARVGTGLLLAIWGLIKAMAPKAAIHVSDTYYHGLLSSHAVQMPLGLAEVVLGFLVVLGIGRIIVLPLQAIVLGVGLAAIWKYILDPFGMYLVPAASREPLFFPSLTVFAASLILIAFRGSDRIAVDRLFGRGGG
jgi:hypothetical protein